MQILRDPEMTDSIAAPDLRMLIDQRFIDISAGEDYDEELHGFFIVVEPGDTVEAIEEACSCRIMRNLFNDVRFGEPGFSPSFEVLEELPFCFEMVFIQNDGGFGIGIFIPKLEGIDAELLAFCHQYATPAPELIDP